MAIKPATAFVQLSTPKLSRFCQKKREFVSRRAICTATATAQPTALPSPSISHIADSVRSGSTTATRHVEHTLSRLNAINPHINAFLTVDAEYAYAQASQIDAAIARGDDPGPMCGVPVAVKDNLCTRGMPTTGGSRILDGFVPPYDAAAVERLRTAGAIILGKTNLDEFGMGSSTELSAYGPTRNPVALDTVPGGSSGGSAAAVAAGLCPAALGSDTGGSIRQPAAFCGVTGIRPSYGRVPRHGLLAYASSFDTVGPLACSVADAALVLRVISGRHDLDATSVDAPPISTLHSTTEGLLESCKGVRVGIVSNALDSNDTHPQVKAAVRSAADTMRESFGAVVEEVTLPLLDACVPTYYLLAMSEASANLARYDGIRYGVRDENADNCTDLYARSRARGFGAEVKRRVLAGTFSLSSGHYDAYYARAQRVRRRVADGLTEVFEGGSFDVLITPVTPTPPFQFGQCASDPIVMYLNDIMNLPASLAGVPAVSVPCGIMTDGHGKTLPIGVQIMAPYLQDDVALRVAHAFQEVTDHHLQTKPLVDEQLAVASLRKH